MSSALRAEQQPRTWWSLSPKSSKQDLNRHYVPPLPANQGLSRYHGSDSTAKSPAKSFPSFASIIGFKSKKHPALAIQDPPPMISCPPSRTRHAIPSQFSQLQSPPLPSSPADSNELVSSSGRERRQSLLTLSDTDPFGVRGIAVHSHEHSTTHSNNSFLDVSSKQDKHSFYARASSSSSSSNSHSLHDSHASNPLRTHPHQKTLPASKSLSNLQRNAKQADYELNGTRSQPNSRPPTRSRGMTQTSTKPPSPQEDYIKPRKWCSPAAGPSPALLASVPLDPHTRPSNRPSSAGPISPPSTVPMMRIQTISRQTSVQRFQPPTAPPTFELPPPPKVPEESALENEFYVSPACNQSFSSSNPSFDSSLSPSGGSTGKETSEGDNWSFVTNLRPDNEYEINHRMKPPLDIPASPQLVRAYSHPSPDQRFPAGASLAPLSEQSAVESPPKVIKKQRSHHRLGLPPISLGFKHTQAANAASVPSLPVPTTTLPMEKRSGDLFSHNSTSAMPARKRVFSGSSTRRPSTSSGIPSNEDDTRSLFSLRSDHEIFAKASPFKPWPADMSASVSCWDDQPLLSPVRSEYTPQQIMSPEDQAKVEAELDNASVVSALTPSTFPLSPARSRATSMSTVFSDRDSEIIPSSILSVPISESKSIRSPQISTRSLISPIAEIGDGVGTSVGRRASQARPKLMYPPSRRPSTASGASSIGFVSSKQTIQSVTSESDAFVRDTSTQTTTAVTPTASVFPPSIRSPQRKGSDVSNNPLTVQIQSLPPPPRPRAKAEVVINTHAQSYSPVNPSLEAGVESSIGIDFGHQRHGPAVSPSMQSMNSDFSIRSGSSQTKSPRIPHVPPVPPRASTRPAPVSSRKTRIGGQQPPPVAMNNGAKLSRRISLQRKPSFLDISDNDDDEASDENLDPRTIMRMNRTHSSDAASFARSTYSTASVAESFLEFGRDSFDTASDQDR